MCFSASASFGAGIVLTVIGIASIKKVQSPSQIFFASIPLIFAVQQIMEGFLWLALLNPAYASLQKFTTYIFLFFAQVVWPFWVPYAILKLEIRERRKRVDFFLVGIGVLVSSYLTFCLFLFNVEAEILEYHISYNQDYPAVISHYFGFFYIIATIAPSFFSRIRHMWVFGMTVLISYIISKIFYSDYVVSVWCFFASIISIAVLAILYEYNKPAEIISEFP
jgi:hypothetical protein